MHQQRFEVDQQRVGRGVVGAQRFAVKAGFVAWRKVKSAAVYHQVALDFLNAQALQASHEQPQALDDQLRITAAFDVNRALQDAIFDGAIHINRRAPCESRAQAIQCGAGGHQLHE